MFPRSNYISSSFDKRKTAKSSRFFVVVGDRLFRHLPISGDKEIVSKHSDPVGGSDAGAQDL